MSSSNSFTGRILLHPFHQLRFSDIFRHLQHPTRGYHNHTHSSTQPIPPTRYAHFTHTTRREPTTSTHYTQPSPPRPNITPGPQTMSDIPTSTRTSTCSSLQTRNLPKPETPEQTRKPVKTGRTKPKITNKKHPKTKDDPPIERDKCLQSPQTIRQPKFNLEHLHNRTTCPPNP